MVRQPCCLLDILPALSDGGLSPSRVGFAASLETAIDDCIRLFVWTKASTGISLSAGPEVPSQFTSSSGAWFSLLDKKESVYGG